ncbi:MAG: hypothetical protein NZ828_11925 [Alphaproteobacteria bacterium]|nr:hypothetical protein [Alphaproteobacteria bacterium]
MKTVYLEHSYLVKEEHWNTISDFFCSNEQYRPVLSDWSVVEIAQGTDSDQAKARVDFVMSLNPLWLYNKNKIQKMEVKSFLYRFYWSEMISPYFAFTQNFYETTEARVPVSYSVQQFVDSCISDPSILNEINLNKDLYIKTYDNLHKIPDKVLKEKEKSFFAKWIIDVLPLKTPSNKMIDFFEKHSLIDFCFQKRNLFYKECKYFGFENKLFGVRFRDKGRVPKRSDALDLEHICASVPYCNFIVAENYLRHISEIANRDLDMGKVVRCISDVS